VQALGKRSSFKSPRRRNRYILSSDFGIGENMSLGLTANYLLSVNEDDWEIFLILDNVDLKARFNANLGNVLKLEPNMDVYPGLNLGLHNFGAHLGFRYFLPMVLDYLRS
jgi:hypothetical protein